MNALLTNLDPLLKCGDLDTSIPQLVEVSEYLTIFQKSQKSSIIHQCILQLVIYDLLTLSQNICYKDMVDPEKKYVWGVTKIVLM